MCMEDIRVMRRTRTITVGPIAVPFGANVMLVPRNPDRVALEIGFTGVENTSALAVWLSWNSDEALTGLGGIPIKANQSEKWDIQKHGAMVFGPIYATCDKDASCTCTYVETILMED